MPRIQHKRGTSANLASVNPTPLAGELVWDSTENAIKIGDGATAWSSLAYVTATPRSHTHVMANISDVSIASAGSPPVPYDVALTYNYSTSSWVAKAIGLVGVGSQPLGGWPAGSVGASLAGKVDTSDARLTDARTPTAHKASHATGGSDALTPSDIGAAPAASPTLSGNVTMSTAGGRVIFASGGRIGDISGVSNAIYLYAGTTLGMGVEPTRIVSYLPFSNAMLQTGGSFTVANPSASAGRAAYGFYSTVNTAAGETRIAFYAAGNAPCFFMGDVGIGTAGNTARLDVNSDVIRLRTPKTPATASSTGNTGDFCWDSDYFYICTSTNTWRRIAHSSW